MDENAANRILVPHGYTDLATARERNARNTSLPRGEVATTLDGQDITRGFVLPNQLAQSSSKILRTGDGYDKFIEVLNEGQVQTGITQRKQSFLSKETIVEPGGDDPIDIAAAESLERNIEKMSRFDEILERMWYVVYNGVAFSEIMWGNDEQHNEVCIRDIRVRDIRRFAFREDCQPVLLTQQHQEGVPLPARKFWWMTTGALHDDDPYGIGLAHYLYWPVFFKRQVQKDELIHLEKYASPTAVGKFPAGSKAGDIEKLLQSLSYIMTDGGIAIPDAYDIQLLQASGTTGGAYNDFFKRCDRSISKIILGQTMTTESEGGQYKADVHAAILDSIVNADSRVILGSFNNTVVRWLTNRNYPGAKYPKVKKVFHDSVEYLKSRVEVDKCLVSMGFRPTLDVVEQRYGDGYIDTGEVTPEEKPEPKAPAPKPTPPPADADDQPEDIGRENNDNDSDLGSTPDENEEQTANLAELSPTAQLALDEAMDELLGGSDFDDAVKKQLQGILDKIARRGGRATLADLEGLFDGQDTDQLETLLSRMIFAAEIWGRASAQAGQ